ncbi:hypothetical protein ATANTOWER_003606 [Ataeniobius toweri]|uniref:Uncharacterized protein n=1 Tax=Ataeniobius toweri TaxID=208326 RepID=A0ABU7C7C0_9TELE|nr:hypothetical protein [Ataeniobius toweri]
MSQQSEKGLGRRFYVLVAGKTNGAHHSIVEKMKNVGQVEAYSQDDCDYLLVFCPIASRVQTDINEALRKIQSNKPVILVVMHHTFNPNLVIAGSRNQVQDPNVHLTVDYYFFEHELLNCNRNKISWHEIQKFLRVSISRTWLQTLIEGVKENALTVTLFIVDVACITFVVTCIVLAEKGH